MRFKRKPSDTEELIRAVRLTDDPLEKLTVQLRTILPLMQQLAPEDSAACQTYEETLHTLERLQRTNEALIARTEAEPAPDASLPEPAADNTPAPRSAEETATPAPETGKAATVPKDATLSRRVQLLFDRSASAESADENAPVFSLFGSRRRRLPAQEARPVFRRPAPAAADTGPAPEVSGKTTAQTTVDTGPAPEVSGKTTAQPTADAGPAPEVSGKTTAQTPAQTPAAPVVPSARTPARPFAASPASASATPAATPPARTPVMPQSPTPLLSQTDAAAPPVPPMYKVQFSAVAPGPLLPGGEAILHLFMAEKDFPTAVEELLRQDPAGSRQTQSGIIVRVALQSPDLELPRSSQALGWQGEYLRFDFAFALPEGYSRRQVLFNAVVYINEVIATRLKFLVSCTAPAPQIIAPRRRDVLSAFLSYAGEDRARAEALLQGMQRARPDLHVFSDVESLRSGENWRETLPLEIARRDVFFLCWSHYAKESFWVNWEWNCALQAKGAACIVPIPLESPDRCPPPQVLDGRHFNDHLLYLMNALQNGT